MNGGDVEDLRLLSLAAMREETRARLVHETAQRHLDGSARAKLAALVPEKERRAARIRQLLERVAARVSGRERDALARAMLREVVAAERAARELHLACLDEARDGEVAALFRELARDEARHVRVAEEALDDLEAGACDEADAEARWPSSPAEPPLWEGVSDLDRVTPELRKAGP